MRQKIERFEEVKQCHPSWVVVELAQGLLDLLKLLLGLRDRRLAPGQTDVRVRLLEGARLVLVRTKILQLLAAVLELGQAERGRRAFEEVAEGRERAEVFLDAGMRVILVISS